MLAIRLDITLLLPLRCTRAKYAEAVMFVRRPSEADSVHRYTVHGAEDAHYSNQSNELIDAQEPLLCDVSQFH